MANADEVRSLQFVSRTARKLEQVLVDFFCALFLCGTASSAVVTRTNYTVETNRSLEYFIVRFYFPFTMVVDT